MKELFELFSQSLGPKAYARPKGNEPLDDRTRLFAMYHKKTHDLVKRTIETEFCKKNGSVRVVFCTVAFGMGVNVKGGNMVIHLGPSSGIDDYLQESGRVGRNNEKAHAVLLRYKGSTRSRNITKEMKEYTRNENICRRNLLPRSFTASPSQNPILLIHVVISVQKNVSVYVPVEPRNVCAKKNAKKVITSPALKNY